MKIPHRNAGKFLSRNGKIFLRNVKSLGIGLIGLFSLSQLACGAYCTGEKINGSWVGADLVEETSTRVTYRVRASGRYDDDTGCLASGDEISIQINGRETYSTSDTSSLNNFVFDDEDGAAVARIYAVAHEEIAELAQPTLRVLFIGPIEKGSTTKNATLIVSFLENTDSVTSETFRIQIPVVKE